MVRRRSKLETMIDILRAMKQGEAKPTCIMYAVRISWKPLQRYLKSLIDMGLVVEKTPALSKVGKLRDRRTHVIYEITEKGEDALNKLGGPLKEFR